MEEMLQICLTTCSQMICFKGCTSSNTCILGMTEIGVVALMSNKMQSET